MNKYKDGEWEYIDYFPLEQSIVPCPGYCDNPNTPPISDYQFITNL